MLVIFYELLSHYCVVNGGWSSWTCESCSTTCGDGTKQCSRKCNSPVPSCGGYGCSGPSAKVQYCTSDNPGKIIILYVLIYSCQVIYCTVCTFAANLIAKVRLVL